MKRSHVGNKLSRHLFIAAPNALTFFLGHRQTGLGNATLYEYDFEGINGGRYKPPLSLPL
ncbi:SAVED domain-containing protein [Ralstonia pickettii]|nr:SAVED domain-containing protein [Ralstonia pickettii]